MATFTLDRTLSAVESGTAVNDGASDTGDFDLDASGYYAAEITVTFHVASGTPSGDITFSVYLSGDGTSKLETDPSLVYVMTFSATGDQRKFLGTFRADYVRVKCENDCGENGTWDLDIAGLKQVST